MKSVMELARELGDAIALDPVVREVNEARIAYNQCEALSQNLAEYNTQREILTEEYKKGENRDEEFIEKVKDRIDTLGRDIVAFPEYITLANAEKGLQALMNEVNVAINASIFGEEPDLNECTHDCSTCGGCH